MRKSVIFIQPGLPHYRIPFYRALQQRLEQESVEMQILVGEQTREAAGRRDQGEFQNASHVKTLRANFSRFSLSLKPKALLAKADLLVAEHGSTVLENYLLLAAKRSPLALWGHGAPFVSEGSRLDLRLEEWQVKKSAHYFAYTPEGARRVESLGMSRSDITTVYNSVDTKALAAAADRELAARQANRASLGLAADAHVGLFVGGIDSAKRIRFLVDAVEEIASVDPKFVLIVAGSGPDQPWMEEAISKRNLPIMLGGYADTAKLAYFASASDLLLIPGRVGLVAVDSFALGLPIVTTGWPFHAPEFDYLSPPRDSLVSDDSLRSYVTAITQLFSEPDRLASMKSSCSARRHEFSIERMSDSFAAGILQCLS